jgi:hypothetical protein
LFAYVESILLVVKSRGHGEVAGIAQIGSWHCVTNARCSVLVLPGPGTRNVPADSSDLRSQMGRDPTPHRRCQKPILQMYGRRSSHEHGPNSRLCAPVGSAQRRAGERDGSIDWLCFPRFDSRSIFGRLADDEACHRSIRATSATKVTRRYLDRTMIVETTFRTPTGTVAITDAPVMVDDNRGHELGKDAPHLLLRRATCVEGEVGLSLEYVPRPEYGPVHPLLDTVNGGMDAFREVDVLFSNASDRRPVARLEPAPTTPWRAGFTLDYRKRTEPGSAKVWSQGELEGAPDRRRGRTSAARRRRPTADVMCGETRTNLDSTSTNDFDEENPRIERCPDEGQHRARKDPVQPTS